MVLSGTLGVMPSASHPENGPSLYEPIHGSASDIVGQGHCQPYFHDFISGYDVER